APDRRGALNWREEPAQVAEQVLRARIDAARNLDLRGDVEVAAPTAGQTRHAAAAQLEHLAALRPRRDHQMEVAVDAAHGDPRAEHRFDDADGQRAIDI